MRSVVPIVIPAYEPDERLIDLLIKIKASSLGPVILVDDGSGTEYESIFSDADKLLKQIGGKILRHEINQGKGRALKTAFQYVIDSYKDAIGVVTADSDGQHSCECIEAIKCELVKKPNNLILGERCFDGENIPWKSVFGNKLTLKVFKLASGIYVSDTQTGLRGIPKAFMKELLDVEGERFEFEMKMLLESVGKYPISEVKIKTIYDSKENHQTHFNPFLDSIKIYKILGKQFFKYVFSSLSSCIVDLIIFYLICLATRGKIAVYVTVATVGARIFSSLYNYTLNYKFVFNSDEKLHKSAGKYFTLVVAQMLVSAGLVTLGVWLISSVPEVLIKLVVDTALFFISYRIQKRLIF